MSRIILASSSPRRVELLREMGVEFEIIPSRAAELHDESLEPRELCAINAQRKAAEVATNHPESIGLGADTLVALDRKLYGKPADLAEARGMLTRLSGKTHEVITAVCLLGQGKESAFHAATEVRFKELSAQQIEAYLSKATVLDKAGAYGLQEHGEMLVAGISGSYSNVVGLPVERLAQEFDAWGIPHNWRNR